MRAGLISPPVAPPLFMASLLISYLAEREASPRYVESLQRTVRRAAAYGLCDVGQLTPENANDFLRSLALAPVTRGNIRRELLSLWRYAFERGFTEETPRRVMRIKQKREAPQAWSAADLNNILDAAEADQSGVHVARVSLLWSEVLPAWIGIGYDSGLRFSDILLLRDTNLVRGCITVTASKTSKATVRQLSGYSWAAAQRLLDKSPDGSLFRWCITRRRMLMKWRSFLNALGMPGSSRWLRRSAATFVELNHPGAASSFLSHSNPSLARLHYIDPSLLGVPVGPPPMR